MECGRRLGGMGSGDGGGAKIRRLDARGSPGELALVEDRISPLPDELRQRILTHLQLKEAIRTGTLGRGWRHVWKSRWRHRPSDIHLLSLDDVQRELAAVQMDPRPRGRIDRLSLIVGIRNLPPKQFQIFMDYAAECRVQDFHVEARELSASLKLKCHIPLMSPLLVRLSIRNISISNHYFKNAKPFQALEVLCLHSVNWTGKDFKKLMALCPSLLTLDLRQCLPFFDGFRHWPPRLRSVTMVAREGASCLDLSDMPALRSFRYSGRFNDGGFFFSSDAKPTDLHLFFHESLSFIIRIRCGHITDYIDRFHRALPNDLSGLAILTVCSNVLQVVAMLDGDGQTSNREPKMRNLHGLRELRLVMKKMKPANLADIYMFLKTCECPNLERLFVQLPEIGSEYEPMEASLDEVGEEPPNIGLDNLKIAKVMNFSWRCTDVWLVSFLLRKASSLHELILVSPNVDNVDPLDMPGVHAEDLLLLKEAIVNGKIILMEADDDATQPFYHFEVFPTYSSSSPEASSSGFQA